MVICIRFDPFPSDAATRIASHISSNLSNCSSSASLWAFVSFHFFGEFEMCINTFNETELCVCLTAAAEMQVTSDVETSGSKVDARSYEKEKKAENLHHYRSLCTSIFKFSFSLHFANAPTHHTHATWRQHNIDMIPWCASWETALHRKFHGCSLHCHAWNSNFLNLHNSRLTMVDGLMKAEHSVDCRCHAFA